MSAGTGERQENYLMDFRTENEDINEMDSALTMVGFWLRSNNGFNMSTSVSLLNTKKYLLKIGVSGNCQIEKINLLLLIVKKFNYPSLEKESYFFISEILSHTADSLNTFYIENSGRDNFLMGFSGMMNSDSSVQISFYWTKSAT